MLGLGERLVHVAAGFVVADVDVSSSRASGAPGSSALSAVTTAGSAAYSTSMALTASCARARLGHDGGDRHARRMDDAAGQQGMRRYLHARHHWRHRHVQRSPGRRRSPRRPRRAWPARHSSVWSILACGCGLRKRHVQHARQLHVVHITSLAGDQYPVFDTPH